MEIKVSESPIYEPTLYDVIQIMQSGFAAVDARFEAVDARFDSLDTRLRNVERTTFRLEDAFEGIQEDITSLLKAADVTGEAIVNHDRRITALERAK